MGAKKTTKKTAKRTTNRSAKPKTETPVKVKKDPIAELRQRLSKKAGVRLLNLSSDGLSSRVRSWIPTGSVALDRLFGWRGLPTGKVVEVYGPNHIGKSTILDSIFASVQSQGGIGVLADTENSRTQSYSGSLGVRVDDLLLIERADGVDAASLSADQVLDAIQTTIKTLRELQDDKPVVIGWDSLAGTPTKDEQEKSAGSGMAPGVAARLMRSACRQLMGDLGGSNICLVIINHEYQLINKTGYGPQRTTYAGEGLRHAASLRLALSPAGWIKDNNGVVIGQKVRAKLAKDRTDAGNAWMETELALCKGRGVDNLWSVNALLQSLGLAVVSGSWTAINLDGEVIKWQGYNGLQAKVQEDPSLFGRLVAGIRAQDGVS